MAMSQRVMSRVAMLAALSGLVACGAHLTKVGYEGPAQVESSYSAGVTLITGNVTAEPVYRGWASLFFGPTPAEPVLYFDADDQRIFVASLIDELNRLGMLNAWDASDPSRGKADLMLQVAFLRTHYSEGAPAYTLDVELLACAGESCKTERFSVSQRLLGMTVSGDKGMVAKKLMGEVIPRIGRMVRQMKQVG